MTLNRADVVRTFLKKSFARISTVVVFSLYFTTCTVIRANANQSLIVTNNIFFLFSLMIVCWWVRVQSSSINNENDDAIDKTILLKAYFDLFRSLGVYELVNGGVKTIFAYASCYRPTFNNRHALTHPVQ